MLVTLSGMVTLVITVQYSNAQFPMPTTGMLFIVGGITTGPVVEQPVYLVIVTVLSDTVYSKSYWSAKADDDRNIKPINDRNAHKQTVKLQR